jgi:hypothetical protein
MNFLKLYSLMVLECPSMEGMVMVHDMNSSFLLPLSFINYNQMKYAERLQTVFKPLFCLDSLKFLKHLTSC